MKDVLHYGSGVLSLIMGMIGVLDPHFIPGVTIDPATCFLIGGGVLGVGAKADATAAVIGRCMCPLGIAAAIAAVLGMTSAYAADFATKAPAMAKPSCTITSCVGIFAGGSIANNGGNFDVIGTGLQGVAANQTLGTQVGLEYFRNNIYAAGLLHVNYDMALQAPGAGISDHVSYGVCGRVGYSLSSFFGSGSTGQTAPVLPPALANSLMTPYINLCQDRRHGQPTIGTGAGLEALLSANWTVNADYLHYVYNQGGAVSSTVKQTDENAAMLSFNYHMFNW